MHLDAYNILSEGAEQPAAPGSALLGLPGLKRDWAVGELQKQPWVCTLKVTANRNCPLNRKDVLIAHQLSCRCHGRIVCFQGQPLQQFLSSFPRCKFRSKADTIEEFFFPYQSMHYIQKYPEEWMYMQLLSKFDDSILKSNIVYICC